ncbi:MAG TPA: alginate export family protein, partial [Longimicrobiales bacterium]|nr:alginate export family protein [Longimicrobiales bacterium]
RIAVEATLSPRAVLLVQMQDSRTFGEEASTLDGSANQFDMHQAWLQYRVDVGRHALSARVGRQEVVLGNERLVGAVGWSNVGRSFDAARVAFQPAGGRWQVHGLASVVQERGVRHGGDPAMGDHIFLGGWVESAPADIFALHEREAAYRTFTGVDRTTVGGHLRLPEGRALAASLEGSYQFGNQVRSAAGDLSAQDIRAWMAGARVGYETGVRQLPRLGAGLDVLSGDVDPADGTYRAFNTLYATNHKFYGFMDLFLDPAARTQDRGLIDGFVSARIGLPADLALDIDGHGFWLHREFAATSDRFLGWEIDLTLPVDLGPGQRVHLGYSLFINGDAAPLIGLGSADRASHWGYIQASFAVGGRPAGLF